MTTRLHIPRWLRFADWWTRRGSVHAALLGAILMPPCVYAAGLNDRPIWHGLIPTAAIWCLVAAVSAVNRWRWGGGQ